MHSRRLEILDVRQHNLKGFNLSLPIGKITVFTGPSGSGKSSLALNVLFAEGQHRYLESLGTEVKRVVRLWDRPVVGAIKGLPPPIALEQKAAIRNPRSTVATITEMSDLIRLLFAVAGRVHCPKCGAEISALTIDQMADRIMDLPTGTRFNLLAPCGHLLDSGTADEVIRQLRRDGFLRLRVDGVPVETDEAGAFGGRPRRLEVVVDRLVMKPGILSRLHDSLELALKLGEGSVLVDKADGSGLLSMNERMVCRRCGIGFPPLTPRIFSTSHPDGMCLACAGKGKKPAGGPCPDCFGTGLNAFARGVRMQDWTFLDMMNWSIDEAYSSLGSQSLLPFRDDLEGGERKATLRIVEAVLSRVGPVRAMGLGYLKLTTQVSTLSGGEVQRLRLGAQLGRDLTGVLYILDEPTVGLHPREQEALWQHLCQLRDQGNTVIIVEHDLDLIRKADHVVELGPGAGESGGSLIFTGPPGEMERTAAGTTGPYLARERTLAGGRAGRTPTGWAVLRSARKNNLKDITAAFPLGCLVCVTGVSGSGKSTLLMEELYPELMAGHGRFRSAEAGHKDSRLSTEGSAFTPQCAFVVDQGPLSKTRYSIPATYLGVFTHIRTLFSRTPEARSRGFSPGHFSLSQRGGRCERCQGQGFLTTDLKYLPPVTSTCDVCGGTRFNRDALQIRYKGVDIAEILAMGIAKAAGFFARVPVIRRTLEVAERTGLGYLRMGQPAPTLSGGEAQRLKLAKELARPVSEPTIYLLDEPSRGLHPSDLEKFFDVLRDLLEKGNSVILIEHQTEILASADWIIELGPGGGPQGGEIVAEGPPAAVAQNPASPIGPYLAAALAGRDRQM
jgi:excinuclease ABC subunit A